MPEPDSLQNGDDAVGPSDEHGLPGVEVPEYPALASNVSLIGEMRETGFAERQWLVQRGDRFIQLTELLYRVAEKSNGERTLGEIAVEVTKVTDWVVSSDNVRQMIQDKLLPLGLIAPASGVAELPDEPTARARVRSPLAVNMRQRLIGPRFIDPVSSVLQVLFALPVAVPLLLAIVIGHGWLYLVHGVGRGLRQMILEPGLTLAVLAIVFVAGIFHEFGHAAALRYGGGRARGMGFGLYLVYPALYTDTTDSYRLGRWGRVRTDLGGFYFHLIFAVGVMTLYLLTGWEFLLVAVLVINLDILYQCLPFVRFDGYWTLADLTGIPDFFSQMGAFLRSVLPIPGWKGAKLPNLKPWVKAVFAGYVVVTVPVLALLLSYLVFGLPRIATTMWYSLLNQMAAFSQALSGGSVPGMALSVAQILILGLQALAISYLLYKLGRMLLLAMWKRIGAAHRAEGETP